MNLIERVKNITLTPKSEWEVVSIEPTTNAALYKGYIIPLSAIGPIASFIGLSIVGISLPFVGTHRVPLLSGLSSTLVSFVFGLVAIYLLALLINALAPTFGGVKNQMQALKVAAFSCTPAWVASILFVLPSLSILVMLAGLYSLYVLYLGLPVLMRAPKEKAIPYTAVVVVCAIVLTLVVGAVSSVFTGPGAATGNVPGASVGTAGESSDALAKLQKMGAEMEAASKKMEQAAQSGNPQAQAEAAGAMMSAAMGGGQFEVVDQNMLKAMLPEMLAGLKRTALEAEKGGMGGLNVSKANGEYGDDQGRSISLTITDGGGVAAFGMLASWAMVEQERQSDSGYEKTGKVDGRPTHEQFSKEGESEYSVLAGNRFLVEARGQQVDMKTLKQAVASIDLAKLDSMNAIGAKK